MLARPRFGLVPFAFASMLVPACADDPVPGDDEAAGTDTGGSEVGETTESGTESGDTTGDESTDTGEDPPMLPLCGTEPPPGAALAPALPSATSSCPMHE